MNPDGVGASRDALNGFFECLAYLRYPDKMCFLISIFELGGSAKPLVNEFSYLIY